MMDKKSYNLSAFASIAITIVAQLSIARPVTTILPNGSQAALPLGAVSSIGVTVVVRPEATYVPRIPGTASPIISAAYIDVDDQRHANAALLPRTDPAISEPSGTADSGTQAPDTSHTTVAIGTVIGMAAFLVLFFTLQIYLCSIADHKVDLFEVMKRTVYYPSMTFARRSITRDHISRTSTLSHSPGNTLRSPSPVSEISHTPTLCEVPMKGINPPAPVLVKDNL